MNRIATILLSLMLTSGSAMAGPSSESANGAEGLIGTVACKLSDAIAAYAAFGSANPLVCDFKPAGGLAVTRFPMKIVAQVEGAPTDRGTIAVWKVVGPAGADATKLRGEYGIDPDGRLGNGQVTLVPAEDKLVPDAMAAMNPAPSGARNVASWIAQFRF